LRSYPSFLSSQNVFGGNLTHLQSALYALQSAPHPVIISFTPRRLKTNDKKRHFSENFYKAGGEP
jgi:hypothetical protein